MKKCFCVDGTETTTRTCIYCNTCAFKYRYSERSCDRVIYRRTGTSGFVCCFFYFPWRILSLNYQFHRIFACLFPLWFAKPSSLFACLSSSSTSNNGKQQQWRIACSSFYCFCWNSISKIKHDFVRSSSRYFIYCVCVHCMVPVNIDIFTSFCLSSHSTAANSNAFWYWNLWIISQFPCISLFCDSRPFYSANTSDAN